MQVKYGSIIVSGSGKTGGSVAGKSRSGAYLRSSGSHIQHRSPSRFIQQARLQFLSQRWQTLTAVQRRMWNTAAEQDLYDYQPVWVTHKTGFSLFVSRNSIVLKCGNPLLTTPPVDQSMPQLTALSFVARQAFSFSVTFNPTPVPVNHRIFLEATTALRPGISNPGHYLRFFRQIVAAGSSPLNALTAYRLVFGDVGKIGCKIFLRARFVRELTGKVGPYLLTSSLITA